ncbi:MAG: TIGR03790 family protein [Bryobacteraceae bacterium]
MRLAFLTVVLISCLRAQTAENVLLVVNDSSMFSRRIGEYYVRKRAVPFANVCHIRAPVDEEITWEIYQTMVERPVGAFLKTHQLGERILYIVTTLGVPLKVKGAGPDAGSPQCAVDSELALLYAKLKGAKFPAAGMVPNPYFRQSVTFSHPRFAMYLVTRLAGYDFDDVKGIIDRSLAAADRGKIVIDLRSPENDAGNAWLRDAARKLPRDRVVLEESKDVLYDQRDVIAYAAWGSNDSNRKRRRVGFTWLPGAIVNEYVSTNGRTFFRPPGTWNITTWKDTKNFFADSPQTVAADYIHEGATGSSGHVYEPFLSGCPRPDILLPAYFSGRNLAESYYLAIPGLSWQNIVIGDPLSKLARLTAPPSSR